MIHIKTTNVNTFSNTLSRVGDLELVVDGIPISRLSGESHVVRFQATSSGLWKV